MAKVCFIGLGVMGYQMAGHLSKVGHQVFVYNRTIEKAKKWAKEFKGQVCESPKDAANKSEYIFVCVGNDDDVLSLANDTEYGLASYIFTNNNQRIQRFSEELSFGEVQVNGVKYAIYLPHGGIKNSGIGHDCSHLALDDYLVKKRVSIAL